MRFLFVVLLCVIGILCSGCAAGLSRVDSFHYWTRYYETRMGLEETTHIRIGQAGGGKKCATVRYETWLGEDYPTWVLVTTYDPEKDNCRPPWKLALHEACHRRMMHHRVGYDLEQAGKDLEAEAKECEGWYDE
jgi:hypothetical protein